MGRENDERADELCEVAGCERASWCRGWCVAHYFRWRNHGDVRADVPVGGRRPPEACSVPDCDRESRTRGLCEMHYRRWHRNGTTERLRPPADPEATCDVETCAHRPEAHGWCHGHYQRWLRDGDVRPSEPLSRRKQPMTCTVEGCERDTNAKGLCRAHRTRQLERGDVLPDVPIGTPTGDGCLSHGYRKVPVPPEERHLTNNETPTLEHRLVMARHLGRPLRSDESVHHINGVKTDNRIENLELWSSAHPKGQRVSDKVIFAVEVLQRYQPELLALELPSDPEERRSV